MLRCKGQVIAATDISAQDDRENAPPDGGYGWVCVVACFIVNFFTFGLVSVSRFSKNLKRAHLADQRTSHTVSTLLTISITILFPARNHWTLHSLEAPSLRLP